MQWIGCGSPAGTERQPHDTMKSIIHFYPFTCIAKMLLFMPRQFYATPEFIGCRSWIEVMDMVQAWRRIENGSETVEYIVHA